MTDQPVMFLPDIRKLERKMINNVKKQNFQYVYLLSSLKSGKWYIGCTNNLRKRLNEHNIGEAGYTKGRGPFNLIYFEGCINKLDAFAREKYWSQAD